MRKINFSYQIAVAGLGNILMGDDGLGLYIIRELKKKKWPKDVLLLELGTSPLDFLNEICSTYYLLIVDAVRGGADPGSIYQYDIDQLLSSSDLEKKFYYTNYNQHGFTIFNLIQLARELSGAPVNASIFGIEPANTEPGLQLSPAVKKSLPEIINKIKAKIKQNRHD